MSTTTTPPNGIESDLSVDELLDLHQRMYRIRCFEQEVLDLRAIGAIFGSVHPCIGQESAPVGVLASASVVDPVLATYRGHGWAVECGVSLADLFAEIMGRDGGVAGARGGSAYLTAPGTRFLGENSIVAAGLPIANGVALAARTLGREEVTIVSFGDGATNQGAAHEAFVLAVARNLPVLFVCENNGWSEMTPISATVPVSLTERARSYGMASWSVDGADVRAVAASSNVAIEHVRSAAGPAFLEIHVPRMGGHYNADIEHYRSKEDKEAAHHRDPLVQSRTLLLAAGVPAAELDSREREVADVVARARVEAESRPPATNDPALHVSGVALPSAAGPVVDGRDVAYGLAVNEALRDAMRERPEVIVFGEDVAVPGGVFGVTRGLQKEFGPERVFDTPISESAIIGAAVGASQRGLRPVAEIMWADFLLVALDQLVNQAANVRYMSEGRVNAPLVVRTQQGATPGSCAQHSQSLEAILAHIPGLKVGMPATAHDAYAMTRAAIDDDDPVVLIESRALYLMKGLIDISLPRETVGGGRLRRRGSDLLIVTWGRITHDCLSAADVLASRGVQCGVLDLRWIAPLDFTLVLEELTTHSGKLMIVHEANRTAGFGAEIAARVASEATDILQAPVLRVATPDVRMPAAPQLQEALIPGVRDIVAAAMELERC